VRFDARQNRASEPLSTARGPNATKGSVPMLDVILIVIAAVFFALSIGYAYACERL
jgi:hypothetical protein